MKMKLSMFPVSSEPVFSFKEKLQMAIVTVVICVSYLTWDGYHYVARNNARIHTVNYDSMSTGASSQTASVTAPSEKSKISALGTSGVSLKLMTADGKPAKDQARHIKNLKADLKTGRKMVIKFVQFENDTSFSFDGSVNVHNFGGSNSMSKIVSCPNPSTERDCDSTPIISMDGPNSSESGPVLGKLITARLSPVDARYYFYFDNGDTIVFDHMN